MKRGLTQEEFNTFVNTIENINNTNLKVMIEMIKKEIKENGVEE